MQMPATVPDKSKHSLNDRCIKKITSNRKWAIIKIEWVVRPLKRSDQGVKRESWK